MSQDMRLFRLRFISPLVENEYKRIRDLNMKSFFKLLIYILIISTLLSIVQNIRIGSLSGFFRVSTILVVCVILLRYGYKIERYIDYILAMLCLGLHLNSVITTGDNIMSRTQVSNLFAMACMNSGYITAIFVRLVILELTRLELKVAFSIASLIARLIMWPPSSAFSYAYQVFFWLLCLFVDIRRERNDRSLFKSFYDFREEIIKFKNLMVSGLPTNILIVSKDIKKKLFLNDYFQTTFQIDPTDELWTPKEWLSLHHIEKDAIHIEGVQDQIRESVNLEEFLEILNGKGLLANQNQNVSFITKITMPETEENRVFEAKVLSLLWDGKDAIMIIMNDVTQQYMNLTLKIADANKDKMIAMVSHELRNPLNGILGMIYIMEKRIEDSEVLKYLAVCKNSGKLLLNLVNSILDLGQIRSNKLKLVLSKGNLAQLLQETYLLFEFQFKQKNLYFKVDMAEDVPESIVSDLNRLRQILINLIANALKFTFEGGVSLHVRKDEQNEENIRFEVTDTGIGIKEDEKRKLFKMYGRLDQSDRKINIEGVGLGLTISDHLVRLLACNKQEGDNINVRSMFGEGTTMSFSIKSNLERYNINERELYINDDSVCEEGNTDMFRRISTYILHSQKGLNTDKIPSRLELDPTPKKSHSTCYEKEEKPFYQLTSLTDNEDEILLKKPRYKGLVLLVDDNPFNIMVAKNLIEGLGYKVQTALNGKIAVDLVKKASVSGNPFNMVLMDCQMPVMDGFEATIGIRRMIEEKEVSDVSIVALSANDSDDDKKRCKDVGMDDHLAKPVSEAKLKGVLDRYCKPMPLPYF